MGFCLCRGGADRCVMRAFPDWVDLYESKGRGFESRRAHISRKPLPHKGSRVFFMPRIGPYRLHNRPYPPNKRNWKGKIGNKWKKSESQWLSNWCPGGLKKPSEIQKVIQIHELFQAYFMDVKSKGPGKNPAQKKRSSMVLDPLNN